MTLLNASGAFYAGINRPWWRSGNGLPRFLCDLITSTAARLRPGAPLLPSRRCWPPDTMLSEEGLGFDSLERLELASAVSAALCMDHSGLDDYLLTDVRFAHWCSVAMESLDRYSEHLTFQTSGSTGVPKSCSHELTALIQEVEALASLLPTCATRVLSAVPCHHIYGFLFTVLLPHRLGDIPVVNVRGQAPGSIFAMARQGDLIVGHPAYWSAVARTGCRKWRPGVTGVTSTAPCPQDLAKAIRAAGLERLLDIHGSSETAGIGWRDDSTSPYSLFAHWSLERPNNLRRTPTARGSGLATSLFQVPDRLEWVNDNQYYVCGRRDQAVQVGGINVFPEHVGQILREHPLIDDVAVRLMNPWEGERLKAFVVLRPNSLDECAWRKSIDDFVGTRLSGPERPRAYTFGTTLPTNSLGKERDWSIAEGF